MSERDVIRDQGGGSWTVRDTENDNAIVARWSDGPKKPKAKSKKLKGPTDYRCPTCGGEPGEECRIRWSGRFHASRQRKVSQRKKPEGSYTTLDNGSTSVRTVSGGGFETNRRRH